MYLKPTYHTLKQIASIVKSKHRQINISVAKVQFQKTTVDCDVYAMAFLTDLSWLISHGINPNTRVYASAQELRKHLIYCFEQGTMSLFPSTARSTLAAFKCNVTDLLLMQNAICARTFGGKETGTKHPSILLRSPITCSNYRLMALNFRVVKGLIYLLQFAPVLNTPLAISRGVFKTGANWRRPGLPPTDARGKPGLHRF